MTNWIAKALDVAQHLDNQIELLIAEFEEAESRPEAPRPPNTQGQVEPSCPVEPGCALSMHPGFLWRSANRGAAFRQHLNCSVSHPFVDFIPVKTVVSADPEGRNFTYASHSIDCALIDL